MLNPMQPALLPVPGSKRGVNNYGHLASGRNPLKILVAGAGFEPATCEVMSLSKYLPVFCFLEFPLYTFAHFSTQPCLKIGKS